jgi:hypothetical protein
MATEIVKVKEIIFDEGLYPRNKPSWILSNEYTEKIKMGVKFPPIFVGKYHRKKYIIDGYHRLTAYKNNGIQYVDCETKDYSDKKEMFIDAVKMNSSHGRPYSFQEKLSIVLRLEKISVDKNTISKIIGISTNNIKRFKAERVTTNPKGKEIVVKAPFKHLVEQGLDNEQINANVKMVGKGQHQVIDMLIKMVESESINFESDIIRRSLKRLYKDLKQIFEGDEV